MASSFGNFVGILKEQMANHRLSFTNLIVTLTTAAVSEIITTTSFKCPCVTPTALTNVCNSTNGTTELSCVTNFNRIYGYSYLFVPASVLFMIGLTVNSQIWKCLTGLFCEKSSFCSCSHFLKPIAFACIAPSTWIAVGFLQGDYYACAKTPLPYVFTEEKPTCAEASGQTSNQYDINYRCSQTIGWICILVFSIGGWLIYACARCCLSKTYYQALADVEYNQEKYDILEERIHSKCKEKAEKDVTKYLTDHPDVKDWSNEESIFSDASAILLPPKSP